MGQIAIGNATEVLTSNGAGSPASFQAAAGGGATQLSDLSDVGVTTATDKNALMADGDSWESRALVEADISDLGSYVDGAGAITAVEGEATLVLGGSVSVGGHAFDDIDITAEFTDTDDHIMSSKAIKAKIEDYGYSTEVGTVTAVTGTGAISSTGGTTPEISIATADTDTTGALTDTDWDTFNTKVATNVATLSSLTSVGTIASLVATTADINAGTVDAVIGGTTPAAITGTTIATSGANDMTIANGNLVIGTSGKGIDFSATAGTGTSELLDDYEEGTWTPVITYAVPGNSSITFSHNSGRYTKIGRIVKVTFDIRLSGFTKGTASGALIISGLPFITPSLFGYDDSFGTLNCYNATYTGIPLVGAASGGGSFLNLIKTTSAGATVTLDDPSTNSIYWGNISYMR